MGLPPRSEQGGMRGKRRARPTVTPGVPRGALPLPYCAIHFNISFHLCAGGESERRIDPARGCRALSPRDAGAGGVTHPADAGDGGPWGPGALSLSLTPPGGQRRSASLLDFFFFLMAQLVPALALQRFRQREGADVGILAKLEGKRTLMPVGYRSLEPNLSCCPASSRVRRFGDKGDFWGCFSSCSHEPLF